jgi:hypothetical protein
MRLRTSLLLLGAFIFAAGTARAVDRGHFETSLMIFAPGSQACAARTALPAAMFPLDIELSTTYAPDVIGYESTACGGR